METVRDILAAHHSGISKPGLLAWARYLGLADDSLATTSYRDANP
jgi:hypothetical protein